MTVSPTPTPDVRVGLLGGPGSNLFDGLASEPVDILVLDTSHPGTDPLMDWLLEPTDLLFARFRGLLKPGVVDPIVVLYLDPVAPSPDHDWPIAEAAFASLQAVVQSLAMEHPRTRATAVRARRDQEKAVRDLVAFLASPAGGYVSVTTIDLRSAA